MSVRLSSGGIGGEQALYSAANKLANDVDGYFDGTGDVSKETAKQLKTNIRGRAAAVENLAKEYYGDIAVDKVGMMKNAFLLMSYNAINRYNPDFQLTKLGIFTANEIRSGLAFAYAAKDVLETTALVMPNKQIAGMPLRLAGEVAGAAAKDLLDGQLAVLSDVGSLALMHKKFTAGVMAQQDWLSGQARSGFGFQFKAEQAEATCNMDGWRANQTEAAVRFGIHEQKYLLQPMWDKPLKKSFAALNDWP